jgi:hypothetical protein
VIRRKRKTKRVCESEGERDREGGDRLGDGEGRGLKVRGGQGYM